MYYTRTSVNDNSPVLEQQKFFTDIPVNSAGDEMYYADVYASNFRVQQDLYSSDPQMYIIGLNVSKRSGLRYGW